MIHHISVSAKNPQLVAQTLAKVLKGQAAPFPPHPGSYIVFPGDEHGTAVEVYPLGSEIVPGTAPDEQCMFVHNDNPSMFTATHAAISVPVTQEEIEQVGMSAGWRVVRCNRDSLFDVMEFWVENRLMIELLTPEMASQYLAFTKHPEKLQEVFATATN
ncbi:MAG: hypothetical protein KME28_13490 [Pelatocladus maniniholoensis HA4357-MV3]|jgi:hypothetical protein|uniref:Uncharacterized protein n=1 Tax=Pelatocladus maniniholoensis HA4357-MV3 TaxID=1117104 RepID=A0A9E3H830_9NOST|nr:hypothetical protein [Pelatocladus maniniholoensis HA4357-MV3]